MIVRKIWRTRFGSAKSAAQRVRALLDYIRGPSAGGGEKAAHHGALNLLNLDHDGQAEEMIDLAETGHHSAQPIQHWILSWPEGEQPSAAQADEAVKLFLGEMGLAEHQAIYALHRDTHNWHIHLAINRIHPETEKVVRVNKGWDCEIAFRAIARIEQRQGWEPAAHAIYGFDPAGEITRLRPRYEGRRKLSARARDFEERMGERSAERVSMEDAAPIIRRAASWRELHEGLAERGIRFETTGSGALIWVGDLPVKASRAGRDCSMSELRQRLGEFEPSRAPARPLPPPPRPLVPWPSLSTYVAERHKHQDERAARRKAAARQQAEILERHRRERAEILKGSWRGRGELLTALRTVTAARQARERAELRDRQRLERAAASRERGPLPSYGRWLAARDRAAVNAWRHRGRPPAALEGPPFEMPNPEDARAVRAVVDLSESRAVSTTAADVYRRHLDAVLRQQPARSADPSRLDAEVAVRMAVVGHSREEIADAIRAGARGDRPDERRDWDHYARRATDFAFSPPGQALRDRLVHQKRSICLEGRQAELDVGRRR